MRDGRSHDIHVLLRHEHVGGEFIPNVPRRVEGQIFPFVANGGLFLAGGPNDIVDENSGSLSTEIPRLLLLRLDKFPLLHEK